MGGLFPVPPAPNAARGGRSHPQPRGCSLGKGPRPSQRPTSIAQTPGCLFKGNGPAPGPLPEHPGAGGRQERCPRATPQSSGDSGGETEARGGWVASSFALQGPELRSGQGHRGAGAAVRTKSCTVPPPPEGTQESRCPPWPCSCHRAGQDGDTVSPRHGQPTHTSNNIPSWWLCPPLSPFSPKPQHTGAGFVPRVPWPRTCRCPHRTPPRTCRCLACQPGSLGPSPNMRSLRQKAAIYDMLQKKKKEIKN